MATDEHARVDPPTGGRRQNDESSGRAPPISELLEEIRHQEDEEGGDRITIGQILDRMRGRAHGLVLVLLGLPEAIPMVGLSAILAAPIFGIGVYMVVYGPDPPLPGWVRRRSVQRSKLETAVEKTRWLMKRLERLSRPRWGALGGAGRLQGAVCIVLAVVLAIPMPGPNIIAAFGVVCLGLAILQRDGLLVAVSLTAAGAAVTTWILMMSGAASVLERVTLG